MDRLQYYWRYGVVVYHDCTTLLDKGPTQVLRRFNTCLQRVGDARL